MTRTMTALTLLLAATACNRAPAANNTAVPAPANAAQGNVVIAPPMAPPATNSTAVPEGDIMAGQNKGTPASATEGCAGEIGLRAAEQLALQCRDVSPATRPPCNPANACAMIREEIARGCGMLGADAPDFCPPAG